MMMQRLQPSDNGGGWRQSGDWRTDAAQRVLNAMDSLDVELSHEVEPAAEHDDDLPQIDGYLVEEEIGRGGGGAVFSAYERETGRRVALKILHRRPGHPIEEQRVWRELEAASRFEHAPVPRLLGHVSTPSGMCLIFDYIEGENICASADQRGLGLSERVRLLVDACRAVQAVHAKAILHRDLKPSHVLVDADRRIWIIDLGLAAILEDDPTRTITADGRPIGTPMYMSPEQARGERDRISTRSDVYGLGAIGYELLAGDTPHDRSTQGPEFWWRVGHEPARDPRSIDPRLPRDLAAILAKACAQDPDVRYQSAEALALDLEAHLAGRPLVARPPSRWQRLTSWIARHPIIATAAACLAIILTSLVTMYAAGRYYLGRPDGIWIDRTRGYVALRAPSGFDVESWEFGLGRIAGAFEMRGPAGEPLVVIGGRSDADELAGHFIVRPMASSRVLWTSKEGTPIVPLDWLGRKRDTTGAATGLRWVTHGDVYQDRAGEEIIAVFQHPRVSDTCIRVYAVDGTVLYERWHNGWVSSVTFLNEPRRIVLGGVNSEAGLDQLGGSTGTVGIHPWVIYALAPERVDGVGGNWIDPAADLDHSACWYARLVPHDAVESLCPGGVAIELVSDNLLEGEAFGIELTAKAMPYARVRVPVTADGVSGPARANEVHKVEFGAQLDAIASLRLDHEQLPRVIRAYREREAEQGRTAPSQSK